MGKGKGITKYFAILKSLISDGFFHILTGNVMNKAISMISSIVIASLVEKESYGFWSYAVNLYSYLALLSGLGTATALLKYCGIKTDKSKDKAYFLYAGKIGISFELSAALILCVVTSVMDIPFPEARVYIWALCLFPCFSYIYDMLQIYARTQGENKKFAASGLISSSSICVFSVLFVLLLGTIGLAFAKYLARLLVIVFLAKEAYRRFKNVKPDILSASEKKAYFKMAFALMIAAFFSGIIPLNEAFLVNHIIRDEIVTANFHVASLFPQLLTLVSGAFNIYFFPKIAQMDDWKAIRSRVHRIGLLNMGVIITLTILGMLCTPLAIRLLYGNKYIDAVPIAYLLWCMRAMNACVRSVPMNMLPAIGKTKFNAWLAVFSCIGQIAIDYFFISNIGITGVAWGAITVYGTSGIAYWLYFESVCKKEIKNQSKLC